MVIAIDAETRLTGLTSVTVSNRDPASPLTTKPTKQGIVIR
jgi:hypothetical protein